MAHTVDPAYRLLASRYLRRQIKQLAEQMDGMLVAEDIEYVHRARVATRRLRSALRMFDGCFPARRVKRWRKAIRHITKELGEARDCDVQIDYLCGVLSAATSKGCFPGIARLLVRLERQRERLQGRVVRAIRRLEAAEVLREIRKATKRVLSAETPQISVQLPTYQRFERHIARRWDDLCQQQACLDNPADHHGHHVMRIAAKRLRYTAEIARSVFAGQLDEAVNIIKKVQTLLGEVHDCDVWLANLDDFAADERQRIVSRFGHPGPFSRLQMGIEYLRHERETHRSELFGELVAFWEQLRRDRFGERLLAVAHVETTADRINVPAAAATAPLQDSDIAIPKSLDASLTKDIADPSLEGSRGANGNGNQGESASDGTSEKPAAAHALTAGS